MSHITKEEPTITVVSNRDVRQLGDVRASGNSSLDSLAKIIYEGKLVLWRKRNAERALHIKL